MRKVLLIVMLLLCMTGCKGLRQTVEVPVEVHDTTFVAQMVHDSVWVDRWHTVFAMGDTVWMRDSVVQVVVKRKVDTAFRYVERPVEVVKTEMVEVEKPLSWWQQLLIHVGVASLVILVVVVLWKLVRRYVRGGI